MAETKISSIGVTFPDASIQNHTSQGYKVIKQAVNYDDSSTVTLLTIPAGSMIFAAQMNITTQFAGTTPTLVVGDAADPDGLIESQIITTTGWKVSSYSALGEYLYNTVDDRPQPKYYASATAIIATIGGEDLTQGVADIYIVYIDFSVL